MRHLRVVLVDVGFDQRTNTQLGSVSALSPFLYLSFEYGERTLRPCVSPNRSLNLVRTSAT
jgi:hypothetical protein